MLVALALCACPAAWAATLDVAWLRDGKVTSLQLGREAATSMPAADGARPVPLGSLWKLFVYLYATDNGIAMPDYHCTGRDREETYCCAPGGAVDRDDALAQSCGPFFAPERLMLGRAAWRRYWEGRLGAPLTGELEWLGAPERLTPDRTVRLQSLLRALAAVPPAARTEAESALLRVVLDGRGAGAVRWFGSRLRVKTFSWHVPGDPARRLGGGAGWLADGTPVWFAGEGTSAAIFDRWGAQLAAALPPARATDSGCVVVDYFTRYPVRGVRGETGPAPAGPLAGRYVVEFANGRHLALRSDGEMTLLVEHGRQRLQGRFGTNEYVARVIDREGGTDRPEAAKALAVAARSYLLQHARPEASCQRIADSTAAQRVSPSPASARALAAAQWTDRLVIQDQPVQYHGTRAAPGMLSWTDALDQASAGRTFDAILARAYPRAVLATVGAAQRCVRLYDTERWLAQALPRWERVLRAEPGYERPRQPPVVCALPAGAPYSEQSRNRVFMRPLATREDRITLAHEYLHIGLRNHPRGQDEAYVERLARRLADPDLGGM
jgi:uncharacterized protein YfaQ (DUF2300 family)